MALTIISGGPKDCKQGDCPTIYTIDDHSDLLVQGYTTEGDGDATEITAPNGEAVVRIPRDVLLQAAQSITQQA